MTKDQQHKFLIAAHELSHGAPNEWRAFLSAFAEYTQELCVDAVQSPSDNAHVARGHAQGMLSMLTLFKELDARYLAVQESRSRHPKRP